MLLAFCVYRVKASNSLVQSTSFVWRVAHCHREWSTRLWHLPSYLSWNLPLSLLILWNKPLNLRRASQCDVFHWLLYVKKPTIQGDVFAALHHWSRLITAAVTTQSLKMLIETPYNFTMRFGNTHRNNARRLLIDFEEQCRSCVTLH